MRLPTEGQLSSFVTAALGPILNLYPPAATLGGHVHEALYGKALEPGEK